MTRSYVLLSENGLGQALVPPFYHHQGTYLHTASVPTNSPAVQLAGQWASLEQGLTLGSKSVPRTHGPPFISAFKTSRVGFTGNWCPYAGLGGSFWDLSSKKAAIGSALLEEGNRHCLLYSLWVWLVLPFQCFHHNIHQQGEFCSALGLLGKAFLLLAWAFRHLIVVLLWHDRVNNDPAFTSQLLSAQPSFPPW